LYEDGGLGKAARKEQYLQQEIERRRRRLATRQEKLEELKKHDARTADK
jgi:hypothetical protein